MKKLWLAVILRAIEDYVLWREIELGRTKRPPNSHDIIYKGGYSWIEIAGPDFREVCLMAGVDPGRVQAAARGMTLERINSPSKEAKNSKPKRPRGRPRIFKK